VLAVAVAYGGDPWPGLVSFGVKQAVPSLGLGDEVGAGSNRIQVNSVEVVRKVPTVPYRQGLAAEYSSAGAMERSAVQQQQPSSTKVQSIHHLTEGRSSRNLEHETHRLELEAPATLTASVVADAQVTAADQAVDSAVV